MSGPVTEQDRACDDEPLAGIELREGRTTAVGGLDVARVLPTKGRRTVGPWCFVDLIGPADAEEPDPLEVGPHPHIGLSTVTWLLEGEALHSDSLGTEQTIRPGQLNWMTAGHGIAHAELAAQPPFRGVQMWVAQPEATRHGEASFEHHPDLPVVEVEHGEGTLLAGAFEGLSSPARTDWPLVGLDLRLRGATVLPTRPAFEHAVIAVDEPVRVGGHVVDPGWLALVPAGIDELPLEVRSDGRAASQPEAETTSQSGRLLVLGGEPLGEEVAMWWNFVARDRDELTAAWHDWQDRTDRFGEVASKLDRIAAPRPPWLPSTP